MNTYWYKLIPTDRCYSFGQYKYKRIVPDTNEYCVMQLNTCDAIEYLLLAVIDSVKRNNFSFTFSHTPTQHSLYKCEYCNLFGN